MTLKQEIASSGYGKIWQSRRYRKAVLNGLQNVGKKPWMPKNDRTGISWTDVTWNTHNGCQKISEGCRFCYADSATGPKSRQGFGINGKPPIFGAGRESAEGVDGRGRWKVTLGRKELSDNNWKVPHTRNRRAIKNESIILNFSDSMGDYLEDHPTVSLLLPKLWKTIRETPHVHWLLCTKRAERIRENLPEDWWDYENGYANVWLGVSVENADYAYRFNDHLANIPAACRFVSYEPALGPIHQALDFTNLDWGIVGGESFESDDQREKRIKQGMAFDHQWARDFKAACEASDTTFFFKQDSNLRRRTSHTLDGQTHYNFPVPRQSALIREGVEA
jgi:protein gp37